MPQKFHPLFDTPEGRTRLDALDARLDAIARIRRAEGGPAANDFTRSGLDEIERTQGKRAALDFLHDAVLHAATEAFKHQHSLTPETVEAFRPATEAANRAANMATPRECWTGEPTLRIVSDACRVLGDLAIKQRQHNCALPFADLHRLSQIPTRLHCGLSRLLTEALPAIHHAATNKTEADLAIKGVQAYSNAVTRTYLMPAYQAMQGQSNQLQEPENLIAREGSLLDALQIVCSVFHMIAMATEVHAPGGNPQSMMAAADIRQMVADLEDTLRHCASV